MKHNSGQATVTTDSKELFRANADRSYLLIQNQDAAAVLKVVFGWAGAYGAADGVLINPSQQLELIGRQCCPEDRVFISSTVQTNAVFVMEGSDI